MWFKNLLLYRFASEWKIEPDALDAALARDALQPCGSYEMERRGWVPPRDDDRHLIALRGQWLVSLGTEKKLLPASVVKDAVRERAADLERKQQHPVGRRQIAELRERAIAELMPRALGQRRATRAWIDTRQGLLAIDAAAETKADGLLEMLRRSVDGLPALRRIDTEHSPGGMMTRWASGEDVGFDFTLDHDLELMLPDASRATVRYVRHALDEREIRAHVAAGKRATQLGLTWKDRVSFVLTDQFQVKRIGFQDVTRDDAAKAEDAEEQFELDFALMTGELSALVADLIQALGGEKTVAVEREPQSRAA